MNAFASSTNPLVDGITMAAPPDELSTHTAKFNKKPVIFSNRSSTKKNSDVKNRELKGSNPIAHTYTTPFAMPKGAR